MSKQKRKGDGYERELAAWAQDQVVAGDIGVRDSCGREHMRRPLAAPFEAHQHQIHRGAFVSQPRQQRARRPRQLAPYNGGRVTPRTAHARRGVTTKQCTTEQMFSQ